MSFQMYVPTRILFGAGQLNHLHEQAMPGTKALITISNGKSTIENGALSRTQEELEKAGIPFVVFNKIMANPLKSTVMEGAACARENGCDLVVALGGGSVMDAAKAIAAMAVNDGDLWDYVVGGTGKGQRLTKKPLPIVAITTTAGTGSEVDAFGVITNDETNEKIGFGGQASLFPAVAVVDPQLMASVPPLFTAYQGFDALFHSTEGYMSGVTSLMGDMVQLAAIENIGKYLARAVKDGSDMEAREHVAFANTMSGYSMVVASCTSEHSMEHAMSAYHPELPHGAGLVMISKEYYTHFINKHCCDERFIRMAQALGKEDAKEPMDFVTALADLQEACGVADLKMSDYGIKKEDCMTLAKNARATMGGLFMADPVQMTDEECAAIYEKSWR